MRTRLLPLALLLALLLAACDSNDPADRSGIVEGERAAFGDGFARAWAELDADGAPVRIALAFDEAAFQSLTTAPADDAHAGDGHAHGTALDLRLPDVEGLPFQFVEAAWNPHGHPPEAFLVPHFDFHFYRISMDERAAIDPRRPDWEAKQNAAPTAAEIPEAYVSTVEAVPQMGVHWIDTTDPTYAGTPFTEVLIYGFWDGDLIFVEPMITAAMLAERPTVDEALKLPQAYPEPGYYPTRYRVHYDAATQEYVVALGGLVMRP